MVNDRGSGPHRPNSIQVALAVFGVLAVGVLAWWLWPHAQAFGFDNTVRGTEQLIRSWGAWGVLDSIGLMVAHSFLPFPAEIVALANGMVYGPLWGALITWTGAMLGAVFAFGLARLLGRPIVRRLLPRDYQRRVTDWSHEGGGRALLVSRLIPVIAFNLINYAAALTDISWWTFLWATGLGILPLTIVLAVLGENVLAMPLWGWLLLGAVALLAWLLLRSRRKRPLNSGGESKTPGPRGR